MLNLCGNLGQKMSIYNDTIEKMKHHFVYYTLFLLAFCCCKSTQNLSFSDEEMTICLRWIPSYTNEKEEDMRTGLAWGMSMLGAEMPVGCMEKAFIPLKNKHYLLNINFLHFSYNAKKVFKCIFQELKKSEEYKQKSGIDIGRFLVLTLHSSWNYYAITGMPRNYSTFKKIYAFDKAETFPVIKSCVSTQNRIVRFPLEEIAAKMAFIAEEGRGKWENGQFEITDREVFDVMQNGQLRFGIYDKKGKLEAASPLYLGAAGKPGKCMWCHERNISKLFTNTPDPKGYMTATQFDEKITKMNDLLLAFQAGLETETAWDNPRAHTLQELLYIGFMEPNLQRIAAEWEMSEAAVFAKIGKLPTHLHEEFDFLGNCYQRKNIDSLALYRSLRVPESVREPSEYEPFMLK